jgi:hypothetical protein
MPGLASTLRVGRPTTVSAATDRELEAIRRSIVGGKGAAGVGRGESRGGRRDAAAGVRRMKALVVAALLSVVTASSATAAGPWKGEVVDAATRQPLPDVIVFAVWWKKFPALIHEGHAFHHAVEVVTDQRGEFEIPRVSTFTLNPFARIEGPDLTVFRPAYGRWRFQGQPPYPAVPMIEVDAFLAEAWKRFEREGVVIEIPPVRDVDERLAISSAAEPYREIPETYGVRLRSAVRAEWNELARLKSGGR